MPRSVGVRGQQGVPRVNIGTSVGALRKLGGRAGATGLLWKEKLMWGEQVSVEHAEGLERGGCGRGEPGAVWHIPSQCTPRPPGPPGTGTWCCWLQVSQRSPLSPGGHVQRPVCRSQWPPWHWQPGEGEDGMSGQPRAPGYSPPAVPYRAVLTPAALLREPPVARGTLPALGPPSPWLAVALPTLGVAVGALGGRSTGAWLATPAALKAEVSFL